MTRTTPPRPADITAVFPQLTRLARTATRLHPRPGAPSAQDSSIGGPLRWPSESAWPYCEGPHRPGSRPATSPADVRLLRQIRTAADQRPPGHAVFTAQEQAELDRIKAGHPWPEGPVAMLPVAQLYLRDVPRLPAPAGADLLQVLWCPFDHPDQNIPRTSLFWRSAESVGKVLEAPPEPVAVKSGAYLPVACLIEPEEVTEFPDPLELGDELCQELEEWSAEQKAGAPPDSGYHDLEEGYYRYELSVAPGWKVGGWAPWGLSDPVNLFCAECDAPMAPLLTIASAEWDDTGLSWIPYEDQQGASPEPTQVMIGSGDTQQLYICTADPTHPHTELMQ